MFASLRHTLMGTLVLCILVTMTGCDSPGWPWSDNTTVSKTGIEVQENTFDPSTGIHRQVIATESDVLEGVTPEELLAALESRTKKVSEENKDLSTRVKTKDQMIQEKDEEIRRLQYQLQQNQSRGSAGEKPTSQYEGNEVPFGGTGK